MNLFLVALAVLSAILTASPAVVSAKNLYAPPGLYDVERIKLSNGLQVILKRRTQAHNVSLRLAVNLGTRHFSCEQFETPHLIEHLLFSGTSRHSEAELQRLIAERGGTMNAVTGQEYTVYKIDIFDRHVGLALDTLHAMMTDTTFTAEKTARAREIVAREFGGRPSYLRQFLYRYDIGKTALGKANEWLLPGSNAYCGSLPAVDRIPDDAVIAAFRESYTPGNMTLIAVGNFEGPELFSRIRSTFGSMEAKESRPRPVSAVAHPAGGPVKVAGTLAPFLGSSGYAASLFRINGSDSADAAALAVLTSYLDTLLYELIRVEKGLSYSPEVSARLSPDYGILSLSADAGLPNIHRVHGLIEEALKRVVNDPPSAAEVERTKQKLLLQWVRNYETNADFAGFYTDSLHDLLRTGSFRNYEREIEGVTATDVERVIKSALREDRRAMIDGIPTFSYTRFYTIIGAAGLAILMVIVIALRRMVGREKRIPWYRR